MGPVSWSQPRESRKRAKKLAFFSVKYGQMHSVPTSEPLTFHEEPIKFGLER